MLFIFVGRYRLMLLPDLLFAQWAKLGLEGDCLCAYKCCVSVQNSNSCNGSVAEAGRIYWHIFVMYWNGCCYSSEVFGAAL